jgi:hypothetical protein
MQRLCITSRLQLDVPAVVYFSFFGLAKSAMAPKRRRNVALKFEI